MKVITIFIELSLTQSGQTDMVCVFSLQLMHPGKQLHGELSLSPLCLFVVNMSNMNQLAKFAAFIAVERSLDAPCSAAVYK